MWLLVWLLKYVVWLTQPHVWAILVEPELSYDTPEMISYLSWFTGKEKNLRKQQELRQREREQMNSTRNITIKVTLSWPVSEGFSHFHVRLCSVISHTYLLQDPKVRRRVRGLGKSHHGRNNPKTKWLKVSLLLCVQM